ncbi:glycosyltransferase [Clostridium sp. BNL1100]|uniref:glycosyltransferase n=1 Tax=Clostridium sp. BNL1100 TaxID=755731 RepID=UPI00024A7294|nr:glycosyltransferase [Clostridium sp. BNL1100]AEY66333.1 putative glycosyltransferase [Clostridium sp. BNL1100]
MKKASIVIPTMNKLSRLRLILKALESQVDDTVEVIIIFDGCSDEVLCDFKKLKLGFEPIQIIYSENVGRSKARNSGILKASGEIVIFLDDDRIPCSDFISKHVISHKNGRFAIVGQRNNVEYPEEVLEQLYLNGLTESDYSRIDRDSIPEPYEPAKKIARLIFGQLIERITFSTGNSSARREDLIAVNMFDENFTGWGLEDTDLGYRLGKSGVKIKRNFSIVNYHLVHPVNKSQQSSENQKNFEYFLRKIEGDKASIRMAKFLNKLIYR